MSHYIIHHVPGRLRLKFPQLRNQYRLAKQIESAIGVIHGVKSAEISTVTGSLLIRYDAKRVGTDWLFAELEQTYQQFGLLDTQATSVSLNPVRAGYPTGKLADRLVDMMVEKCIERSAIALLGVLL